LALAALLAVSLGGKLAVSTGVYRPSTEAAAANTAANTQRMLSAAGFDARIIETYRSPRVFVDARRGSCHIIAGDYPPNGIFRDVYRDLAAPVGKLRFVYRGQLHEQESKLLGLFDYYVWSELRRIGVKTKRRPAIAVAASEDCVLQDLPWTDLAEVAW